MTRGAFGITGAFLIGLSAAASAATLRLMPIGDLNRNPQQIWSFTQSSDTSWNIVNARSNKALYNAGAATNGPQVIQWTADSTNNNQRWWVDRQSDGTYKIWSKGNSRALDNSNNTTNGYKIIQWDWNGGTQQRWNIR